MNQPTFIWIILAFLYSIRIIPGELYQDCLNRQEVVIQRNFYVDEYDLPLRIEMSHRITHRLVSHILRVLLHDVLGYSHVLLIEPRDITLGDNTTTTLQKISNCKHPKSCKKADVFGPEVMINLELWLVPGFNLEDWVTTEEVEDCGPLGPIGRYGWYIPEYSVRFLWENRSVVVDHWRAFTIPEVAELFYLSEDDLPHESDCSLKECDTYIRYRPPLCRKPHIRCATLLLDYPTLSAFRLVKHQIEELNLFVNVAFVGDKLADIVEARADVGNHTMFFQRKPMFFSTGHFNHVSFPHCEDDTSTACEFEVNQLEKVAWSKIKKNAPYAFYVLRAISFSQTDYLELLEQYNQGKSRGFGVQNIACNWVKQNTINWVKWIPGNVNAKTTLYIGGIFPQSGIYWKQKGVIPAAHMAANAINNNDTLLLDYNLEILEQDGNCAADRVMKSFINYVTNSTYKTMVGILGPACSDTVEPIAGVAKHFNSIIITYSAEGAFFSNREKYPFFFRTIPENNQFRYVYLKLFQRLGYRRVAALTEDGQKYPEYISHLQNLMQEYKMTFIANGKFPRDLESLNMKPYLQDLKDKGAKIIIGDFYDYAARAVMCAAYELGMTAANGYVWFLPLWFSENWFDTDFHNSAPAKKHSSVSCTTEQMTKAINGHLSLAYKYYADDDDIMQEGRTVAVWRQEYATSAKNQVAFL